jgi:hypothetical protein
VIATQQAADVVLGKVRRVVVDQVTGDGRFPPLEMRQQTVLHELGALHFNVRVRAAGEILNHVRRHTERPADLDDLILASLKELGRLVALR